MLTPIEMLFLVIGTVVVIGTFSYIFFPGNKFFQFNEALFIGGSAAYAMQTVYQSLTSSSIEPLLGGQWTLLIPTFFGILVFTRLTTNYRWLARYATGILSGVGVGVTLGQTVKTQVIDSIVNSADMSAWGPLMLPIVIVCIFYYTYSRNYAARFHSGGRFSFMVKAARILLFMSFGVVLGRDFFIEGLGSLATFSVSYFRNPLDEFRVFMTEYGLGYSAQILIAGLAIPIVPYTIYYVYTRRYKQKKVIEEEAS
jgi:hypothetical protein